MILVTCNDHFVLKFKIKESVTLVSIIDSHESGRQLIDIGPSLEVSFYDSSQVVFKVFMLSISEA